VGVRKPYCLYAGAEKPRKNIAGLDAALARVRKSHPDLRFVKVGASQTDAGRQEMEAALAEAGIREGTSILESVSDEDLVALYRGAVATVMPSLEEGFGFPALESLACACPVVLSDRPPFHELAAENAIYVDPLNVSSIAEGIGSLIDQPDLRADLARRGPARTRSFTWAAAAEKYAGIYDEALAAR